MKGMCDMESIWFETCFNMFAAFLTTPVVVKKSKKSGN